MRRARRSTRSMPRLRQARAGDCLNATTVRSLATLSLNAAWIVVIASPARTLARLDRPRAYSVFPRRRRESRIQTSNQAHTFDSDSSRARTVSRDATGCIGPLRKGDASHLSASTTVEISYALAGNLPNAQALHRVQQMPSSATLSCHRLITAAAVSGDAAAAAHALVTTSLTSKPLMPSVPTVCGFKSARNTVCSGECDGVGAQRQ